MRRASDALEIFHSCSNPPISGLFGAQGYASRRVPIGFEPFAVLLQFHHLDPEEKRFALADRGLARSLEKAREEARKCVLLCANCHAELEAGIATMP